MMILSMKIKEVTEVIGRKIIVERRKMVGDLTETIESGPKIILETGGKQIEPKKEIGLENKEFPESIISNQFLSIMEIFNRDHYWFNIHPPMMRRIAQTSQEYFLTRFHIKNTKWR